MEQEYFKPIKNFETYGISNLGNVKDFRTGEIKRQYVNEKAGGYLQVQIKNPSGSFSKRVHRLVGENLIDNPNNLEEIDHIDRNRINNRIDNLRWVSRSDNQINKLYDSHNNNPYKCIHYDGLKNIIEAFAHKWADESISNHDLYWTYVNYLRLKLKFEFNEKD